PVLDDLAAHPAAGGVRHSGLPDVPEAGAARHAPRADRELHDGEPADRDLADVRLLRRHPARAGGKRGARRRLALSYLLRPDAAPTLTACTAPLGGARTP